MAHMFTQAGLTGSAYFSLDSRAMASKVQSVIHIHECRFDSWAEKVRPIMDKDPKVLEHFSPNSLCCKGSGSVSSVLGI